MGLDLWTEISIQDTNNRGIRNEAKEMDDRREISHYSGGREGVVATCRKHGIYASTYNQWKKRYDMSGIDGLSRPETKAAFGG